MAFEIRNLTPIANNGKAGIVPVLWMYWNENDDTITVKGYFSKINGISNGDQLIVINKNRTNTSNYHITEEDDNLTAVSNGNTTNNSGGGSDD